MQYSAKSYPFDGGRYMRACIDINLILFEDFSFVKNTGNTHLCTNKYADVPS